ncbi:conserved hypothetical protein [Alteracholeplasma palmae J233]|uniref:Uncharacterized protein n=1 Tax=Alteracholeplasma palmae (strain ATCC 49389 / J233) TaxID=1318466 RepID=U4KKG1_ALTPJ|nr:hypothetical protein [Alteracholeplasma palmae]CCV64092.1 conserved hypothetical protein [Alteracholeplasma palmae J233]
MKKIFSLIVASIAALVLVACGGESNADTIRMSVWFKSGSTEYSISYRGATPYASTLNGQRYVKGSILPVWEEIGKKLDVTFVDAVDDGDTSTDAQWERLSKTGFGSVDLVNGTGAKITEAGQKGQFVNIAKYLDRMPSLNTLITNDKAAKLSMTTPKGEIFYTPYFDGSGELEHMFLARIDWIEKLLDTNVTGDTKNYSGSFSYTPINGTEGYTVSVANETGTGENAKRNVTKNAVVKNAFDVVKDAPKTGAGMLTAFRSYLNERYGSLEQSGYAKLSDIFAGTDASYDADEMVALMYVIKANEQTLLDGIAQVGAKANSIVPYFQREKADNRVRQYARGLEMFGLRGVNARNEWLFIDKNGELQDTRGINDGATLVDGFSKLNQLSTDGIIPDIASYADKYNFRTNLLKGTSGEFGFLTYDYNGTSTTDDLTGAENGGRKVDENFKFQAILPPVNKWDTKQGNEWFHFSESVRSVKAEAWGIPVEVEKNPAKLDKVLKLVDGLYDYSSKDAIGSIHLYGPSQWLSDDFELYYNPITKQSDAIWSYKQEAVDERKTLAGGDMIKYLRGYLGATMPIGHVRSLGLEYQTLTEDGKEGIGRINKAVAAETFRLAGVYESNDPFYTPVPTSLPLTQLQNTSVGATTFRNYTNNKVLITLVKEGFSGASETLTPQGYADIIAKPSEFAVFIKAYRDAYKSVTSN